MKNAIITGGTGFIGRWLIQELLNNDINCVVLVRDTHSIYPEYLNDKNITLIKGKIDTVKKNSFPHISYDCFYHLAWGGVAPQAKNDLLLQLQNIKMSVHALDLCNSLGCKKFIAAGTVGEYVFSKNIIDVEEKQTPNDIYGAAKASAHYFLQVRSRQLEQPFVWAVIPSTFGEYREDNNIITYTIKTLLKKEKPSYGALTQMWDFLYISEVVKALRLIGEYGKNNVTYGIGSGTYRPLKDYIITIRDLIDSSLPLGINERPEMTKQTFSSCVNILDLMRDTGFQPQISFEEGVLKTIDYWKKQLKLEEDT